MKRKKVINSVVTVVSALYRILFIITFIRSRLSSQSFDFFGVDGLTLTGASFSLIELFLSKRNWISKKINQIVIRNKMVSYQISLSLENTSWTITQVIDFFEESFKEYFGLSELERRPTSSLQANRHNIFYKKLGLTMECQRKNNCEFYEESDNEGVGEAANYLLRISGQGKYGSLASSKKDIVYFTSIIRMLTNQCFTDPEFIKNVHVERVEVILNKVGSQIATENIFNDEIPEAKNYFLSIEDNMSDTDFEITQDGIKWCVTNAKKVFEGAEKLTDLICKIS